MAELAQMLDPAVQTPQVEMDPAREQLIAQRKQELLNYANNFYRASWNWRSQKKHAQWDRWDHNYHSIYNPTMKAKKEPWQVQMFIGLTVQVVEIVTSEIFKTMMAPKPPIQVTPGPAGDELQAELITETIDYELRKSGFEVSFYDALKEAVRYGSGFMKLFWERVEDVRVRKVPVNESPEEMMAQLPDAALRGEAPIGLPGIKGFEAQPVPVLLKNSLRAKYVHIRDIFPEPNTSDWKNVIHRDKVSFGTIVRHIKRGDFFDIRLDIENMEEGQKFEQDLQTIKHERGYFEETRTLSRFEKKHTVWELYADLPRKWSQFDIPEGDDAEELVPTKAMIVSGVAVARSEENPFWDAESPILKLDYIRTAETYGKGVIELVEDEQDEINELRNLRVDNLNLIMNKMVAILEAALVSPKDLVSKPGGVIRLKGNVDDIRKAFMPIEWPDVSQNTYRETMEIERMVQERTGVNRVSMGSAQVKDTNQTLGGMELLKQVFNERMAAYGMIIENAFLMRAGEKIYSLIYQELKPEDLFFILGDDPVEIAPSPMPGMPPVSVPRFKAFVFVPPEVLAHSYALKPMGIFTLENKVIKAAQVMDLTKLFAGNPQFDMIAAGRYTATKLQQIDEAEKWFRPEAVIPISMIPPELLPLILGPAAGGPAGPNQRDTPGLKGGPQGDQPAFTPQSPQGPEAPNPVRRNPVV